MLDRPPTSPGPELKPYVGCTLGPRDFDRFSTYVRSTGKNPREVLREAVNVFLNQEMRTKLPLEPIGRHAHKSNLQPDRLIAHILLLAEIPSRGSVSADDLRQSARDKGLLLVPALRWLEAEGFVLRAGVKASARWNAKEKYHYQRTAEGTEVLRSSKVRRLRRMMESD